MNDTAWHVLLLSLACVAFFAAAVIPAGHPLNAYRLRIVATGLMVFAPTEALLAASVI